MGREGTLWPLRNERYSRYVIPPRKILHLPGGQIYQIMRVQYQMNKEFGLLTLATILPLIRPTGTGPYCLESLEPDILSPQTQTCPLGTRMCTSESAYWPVGSTHTASPGKPMRRLQTKRPRVMGDSNVIRSPRVRKVFGKSVCVSISSITISEGSSEKVGSIEGPLIYVCST